MDKINTINIHFLDACNYTCKHCFVKKESKQLNLNQLKIVVDKIGTYFKNENIPNGRINLAGGEPLLSKDIDEIIEYIYSKNISVSLITNGYYLNKEFIYRHRNHLQCIGISVDSLIDSTNRTIGRCQKNGDLIDTDKLINLCKYIRECGIKLKINTCVSKLNVQEDFSSFLAQVRPDRYKVLQMSCDDFDVVNVKNRISAEELKSFTDRHREYITVVETCEDMKSSYLIIDSEGNIACNNCHISNLSIFTTNIEDAIKEINFNQNDFIKRYQKIYQHSEKQGSVLIG